MESDNLYRVKSALQILPGFEESEFEQWLNTDYLASPDYSDFSCAIVDFDLCADNVVTLPAAVMHIHSAVIDHLNNTTAEDPWGLLDENLIILKLSDQSDGRSGRLLLFHTGYVSRILKKLFPLENITPAEQNTLLQTLSGLTLKQASEKDSVSYETKKTQLKTVFRKTRIRSQQGLSNFLISHLSLEVAANYSRKPANAETDEMFFSYVDQYMGDYVRASVVQVSKGKRFRVVEIGDPAGQAVVCIHHLGLINFSEEEITEIYNNGIRLICPLRHGAFGPLDGPISPQAHLDHSLEGIDLAVSLVGKEKVPLIGLLSGCLYAIDYIKQYPGKVDKLIMFGASYRSELKPESASTFKKDLHELAVGSENTLDAAVSYLLDKVDQPEQLKKVMVESHDNCAADIQIIDDLFSDQKQVRAMQHRLKNSSMSIMQDLRMQATGDWRSLLSHANDTGVHFVHGSTDRLIPIANIRKLVDERDNFHLHPIVGAGNWLFGKFTRQTFSIVRRVLDCEL